MFNARPLSFIEMEAARIRALVKASTATCKKEEKGKEGASLSAPKVIEKGAPKRKADGKDDLPFKKASITPREK